MKTARCAVLIAGLMLTDGCAYPHTSVLRQPPPNQGDWIQQNPGTQRPQSSHQYYFPELSLGPNNSNELFVILAFSGGGTRAAALSYGVLDALRDIKVDCPGRCASLLDEVDLISSVSGGSFTSAYYALRGTLMFDPADTFNRDFLYHNVERDLFGESIYYPSSWVHLFGRAEIAASHYAKHIFKNATYADLIKRPRPYVILNASDYGGASRFEFTQPQFDMICTDLAAFSLSRAVAASSGFPGLLNALTVNTHNDCPAGRVDPLWYANARQDQYLNKFNYRRALEYEYFKNPDSKYLHLLDGGVTDNVGVRAVLEGFEGQTGSVNLLQMYNVSGDSPAFDVFKFKLQHVLIIAVNAGTGATNFKSDSRQIGPATIPVLSAVSGTAMDTVSSDSIDLLTEFVGEQNRSRSENPALVGKPDFFSVELTFDNETPDARAYFRSVDTNFGLPRDTVDCLKAEGRNLLVDGQQYGSNTTLQRYVTDTLHGTMSLTKVPLQIKDGRCSVGTKP